MLGDIIGDFMAAGSAFMGQVFALAVTWGNAIALLVLVIGVVCYFTKAHERAGKTLVINSIACMVILCSAYMIAFSTGSLPDMSGIFVLPAGNP